MESELAIGQVVAYQGAKYTVIQLAGANVVCEKDGVRFLLSIKDVKGE